MFIFNKIQNIGIIYELDLKIIIDVTLLSLAEKIEKYEVYHIFFVFVNPLRMICRN